MNSIKVVLSVVCLFMLAQPTYANDEGAYLVYEEPKNAVESEFKERLESFNAVQSVIHFINDHFHLHTPLVFSFGHEDGPLYDGDQNYIFMPYSFLEEVEDRFVAEEYSERGVSVEDATLDAVMHTLFHEFAHAIIYKKELPVLGREEDAADALAAVLLIEFFDDGQEVAISAADLFNLESHDLDVFEEEEVFWGTHSLYVQRYYSTLCHVYGSDPDKFSSFPDTYFSEERAELCIEEYEQVSRSWLSLLEPHMTLNP